METTAEVINRVLKDIQEQQGYRAVEPKQDLRVVKDMGFASLDVAQLIAMLEMELDVDPFSEGVSIMDVSTVGDLHRVYDESIRKKNAGGE